MRATPTRFRLALTQYPFRHRQALAERQLARGIAVGGRPCRRTLVDAGGDRRCQGLDLILRRIPTARDGVHQGTHPMDTDTMDIED